MDGFPVWPVKAFHQRHQYPEYSDQEIAQQETTREQQDDNYQLSFIQLNDPLLEQIREDILHTDIDTLTPVEALMKLNEIKRLLKSKK